MKEGFFAYMDTHKIGMIDYQTFLTVMNKSIYMNNQQVEEDNWQWEFQAISRIR